MSNPLALAHAEFVKFYEALSTIPGLDILSATDRKSGDDKMTFNIKIADHALRELSYRSKYEENIKAYSLPSLALDEKLTNETGVFRLVGWDSNRKKSPILIECVNSKTRYKMSVTLFQDVYYSSLIEPL